MQSITLPTPSALPRNVSMWEKKGIDETQAIAWAASIGAATLYFVPVARAAYVPVVPEQQAEDE